MGIIAATKRMPLLSRGDGCFYSSALALPLRTGVPQHDQLLRVPPPQYRQSLSLAGPNLPMLPRLVWRSGAWGLDTLIYLPTRPVGDGEGVIADATLFLFAGCPEPYLRNALRYCTVLS
jgi:hypothetical protein